MKVGHDFIDRCAEEGTRLIALMLLEAADDAASRVSSGADAEALHDFRVALRRLRTALRAFRPWIGEAVGLRVEKRLKRCARATNAARDAEVQLAWLEAQARSLHERERAGAALLRERMRAEREDAPPVGRTLERYRRASTKLARRLQTGERTVDAVTESAHPSFGGLLAALVRDQLEAMRSGIDAVDDALDQERIHRARIEAKRLRYLLEPLRGNRHADARDTIEHLKKLQDLLGELHDTHVLAEQVLRTLMEAARDRARRVHRAAYERGASEAILRGLLRDEHRAGLVALDRMLRDRREALFADLERQRREGDLEVLVTAVLAVVGALEARASAKEAGA